MRLEEGCFVRSTAKRSREEGRRLGCAVATLTNRASYRAGWTGLVLCDLCMDSTLKASFAREVAVGFNNFN
jgi:hypothetical protein